MRVQRRRFTAVSLLFLGLASTSGSTSSAFAAPSPAVPPSSGGGGAASSHNNEKQQQQQQPDEPIGGGVGATTVHPEELLGRADFRLAFGSCSRHDKPQSLWGAVRGMKADAFLWLGDAVYADIKVPNKTRVYLGNDFLVDAYQTQNAHPEYAALVRETRVLGTW